jgi:hypothetical protein
MAPAVPFELSPLKTPTEPEFPAEFEPDDTITLKPLLVADDPVAVLITAVEVPVR